MFAVSLELLIVPEPLPRIIHIQHSEDLPSQTYLGKALQRSTIIGLCPKVDSLVDSDEKLPDNARVTIHESAVESVPDLQRVKITDNVLQAQLDSTRPISYRSYFDLLKDAAFHLDQATKKGNKIQCTNVHFSGPNDEDEHQNLSTDDNQVIQQENVCSEPPQPLSYSLFQSHFQGSSTSNTQKIFLPKPIWEKLSKDQP